MLSFLKSRNTIFLLIFSVFSSCLIFIRVVTENEMTFLFLIKNLALAWIPYIVSQGFKYERIKGIGLVAIFLFWLLFFPNTLYTTTDLIYIYRKPGLKVWFDIVLLLSYTICALFLAFGSLKNFENRIKKKYGRLKTVLLVLAVLHLGSIGDYLGRFKRLNSSDVFTNPAKLVSEILTIVKNPFQDMNLYIITFVFTLSMYIFYYGIFNFSKNE